MAAANSVATRYALARQALSARDVAVGLALVTAITFALLVMQDPLAHDSLHNFRHTAGVTCH